MLAYITCKNVVLLITKGKVLANYINLFLLIIYKLCEKDKRISGSNSIRFAIAL
jgi:hypothetical protein